MEELCVFSRADTPSSEVGGELLPCGHVTLTSRWETAELWDREGYYRAAGQWRRSQRSKKEEDTTARERESWSYKFK